MYTNQTGVKWENKMGNRPNNRYELAIELAGVWRLPKLETKKIKQSLVCRPSCEIESFSEDFNCLVISQECQLIASYTMPYTFRVRIRKQKERKTATMDTQYQQRRNKTLTKYEKTKRTWQVSERTFILIWQMAVIMHCVWALSETWSSESRFIRWNLTTVNGICLRSSTVNIRFTSAPSGFPHLWFCWSAEQSSGCTWYTAF